MMRLIALLLSLCFTFNVSASTLQELERQLDEYQYALTVEWDQKDQAFYEQETNKFFNELSVLITQKGLKKEEILELMEKRMVNKADLEVLKLKLTLLGEARSSADLSKILKEHAEGLYLRGASWNGDAVLITLGVLFLVAVVGYSIWFSANYRCVAWDTRWECDSDTYYDSYGNSHTDTVCGWDDYCIKYEKKD